LHDDATIGGYAAQMTKTWIAYHSQRASTELHLGLTTPCPAAARAHLKLSALHFERVRVLQSGRRSELGFDPAVSNHLER